MWIAIQNAVGARQGVGGGPGPTPPPYTPPLDTYTSATAAYSVRKLSSSYSGPCMEVERVVDAATLDIGFDSNGLLDTQAIIDFSTAGGGTGEILVRTWYDQSGNALDAVQTTPADMPQIYDGSAIETNGGKPAVRTIRVNNGAGDHLFSAATTWMDSNLEYACLTVWEGAGLNSGDTWIWDSSGGGTSKAPSIKLVSSQGVQFQALGTTSAIINVPKASQAIRSAYLTSGTLEAFYNSTSEGTATAAGTYNANIEKYIGSRLGAGEGFQDGYFQELIWYAFDQSSNGRALESNLNSYYQIGNFPDYTSGFLADYSGAAAAYSVRKLSNTAIKCMRVRRTTSPFDEQDIGFTPSGDLDTTAIDDFATLYGGNDQLVVSSWYDQSGNQIHVTQAAASQPIIREAAPTSSIYYINGKAAIKAAERTGFSNPTFNNVSQPFTLTTVTSNNSSSYLLGNNDQLRYRNTTTSYWLGTDVDGGGTISTNDQIISFGVGNGSSSFGQLYAQSAQPSGVTFTNSSNLDMSLMGARWPNNSTGNRGYLQEFILWNTDQKTDGNQSGIAADINTYFSTY